MTHTPPFRQVIRKHVYGDILSFMTAAAANCPAHQLFIILQPIKRTAQFDSSRNSRRAPTPTTSYPQATDED
eukprot:3786232-Pleurochrysis_carterae.AAC.1